jgi:hypothetical protein
MRRLRSTILQIAALSCAVIATSAVPAQADFGFSEGSIALSGPGGAFSRQAGAHPDMTTKMAFPASVRPPFELALPDELIRDVEVKLPPGFVGNPTAVPVCSTADLVNHNFGYSNCPNASQIGLVTIEGKLFGGGIGSNELAVYNLEHDPGVPALFGFKASGQISTIVPRVRPDDFGISAASLTIPQGVALTAIRLTLWGVPADSSHDTERVPVGGSDVPSGSPVPSNARRTAFLSNATSCSEAPQVFTFRGDSWENQGKFFTKSVTEDSDQVPFLTEGCEKLRFDPAVTAVPGSHRAGAPTGLDVDIEVPQNDSPDGLATAHVRKTAVTFPRGVSVSPASAAGLGSCAPAQIGLGSNDPPTCPESSKIGTVEIESALTDETLKGDVIVAKQNDNPFNSLLALYLAVKGPGFYLKLPGKVDLDPRTGQLTSTFADTPQLPFDSLRLSLRGGPTAPLVAPKSCGVYDTHIEMTSWASDAVVSLESPMTIDEGCDGGGFAPTLHAASTNPIGGGFSPFTLQVSRHDGEQNISRIDASLPAGQLAKLAGVPLCSDSAALTGSCPAASQVGTATVAAGSGTLPVYVPQPGKDPTAIYLAGPYKGAPYSLVVKVPAQAGPFDLGTVAVRSAISIDPITTQVSVKSDPLPQILQGIPIDYRDIWVEMKRPDFMLNPTSCDPTKVAATIVSDQGAQAAISSRYQLAACGELGFKPKLALSLSGPTHRSAHPKLRAVLTARKGDANIGRAQVTLPKTEFLENAHIQTICTRVQFAAHACPAKSVYGYAKAWSPLLDKPLSGPVYLRSSSHELPDLVASLDGQIHVDLAGRIDSVRSRIRNTFDFVPDAPVSKFVLTMQGGKKGLLVNNTELCKTAPRAEVALDGQNGKVADSSPLVGTDCGKGRKGTKK